MPRGSKHKHRNTIKQPNGGGDEVQAPLHKGMVREDLVILRHLLGLDDAYSLPNDLYLGKNLSGCSIKDVLFVAVDIHTAVYNQIMPNSPISFGISILDTRRLQERLHQELKFATESEDMAPLDSEQPIATDLIQSYHFQVDDNERGKGFLFGLPEKVSFSDLKPRLQTLILNRDFVFVTFGGGPSDLRFLELLQLEIRPLFAIDTLKAAQFPLQLWYRYSLEKLLTELEIPCVGLHVAGNDAHYALRGLLMVAVRDWDKGFHSQKIDERKKTVACIGRIAQAPRPLTFKERQRLNTAKAKSNRKRKAEKAGIRRLMCIYDAF